MRLLVLLLFLTMPALAQDVAPVASATASHRPSLLQEWLSPNGIAQLLSLLGLLAAVWAYLKERKEKGFNKQDADVAFKMAGTVITGVQALRSGGRISPESLGALLTTLQTAASAAGIEPLMQEAVTKLKQAPDSKPPELVKGVVQAATRSFKKTALEAPAVTLEELEAMTPPKGTPTQPKLCYVCSKPITSEPRGEDDKGSFHTACVVGGGV